jgi:hypothetical protein
MTRTVDYYYQLLTQNKRKAEVFDLLNKLVKLVVIFTAFITISQETV